MASKQYTSIIRLFDHCGISTGNDFNLSRAKKQLRAEFRVARNGFIEVNGYTYTLHDVFQELEQPDFTERLIFHKQLWNSHRILQLLEKNSADPATLGDEFIPLCGNKEFDKFFSPYFAGLVNYISRTFLSNLQLHELAALLAYEEFILPAEREEAFRPIRIFLDENLRLMRNINGDNYKMMRPKISLWIDKDWHPFFNSLPDEFYDIKNDMIARMVNIGVAIQKTHRRDCRKMSKQLISLEGTPDSLHSIIVSNHAIYTGSSGDGSFSWRNVAWVGWVLFMIIRASSGGCNDSGSNYKEFLPPKYQFNDSIFKKIARDTSIRRFHDSSGR